MAGFQNLWPSQVISNNPIASALAAGTVVKLTASGWAAADDETVAGGVLCVDVVAAETEVSGMDNVYTGGVEGMARKIYVGSNGPVDTGVPVAITDQIDPDGVFTVGGKVYAGNGLLYASAQNSGSAIGTVRAVESSGGDITRITVAFKFVA